MKIKYIRPTRQELLDAIIAIIGIYVILIRESNIGLVLGILLLISGRHMSLGELEIKRPKDEK